MDLLQREAFTYSFGSHVTKKVRKKIKQTLRLRESHCKILLVKGSSKIKTIPFFQKYWLKGAVKAKLFSN